MHARNENNLSLRSCLCARPVHSFTNVYSSAQMSPQPEEGEDKVELTATGKLRRKRARTVTGCKTCRTRRVKCDEKRVSEDR